MTDIEFTLNDKYHKQTGPIILSGLQALVRLPIDQHLADQRANLNTATFIAGYRGSPLAGLDMLLEGMKPLLDQHNIVFMPAVNEDLAATAVFGSQIANQYPEPKYDGVLGLWYGKAPGVDRSGDVFKHANFTGVGRYGGVLALAGDDPTAKSSTLPSASEVAFFDAQMPVLYPGNVQEVIEFGRYGFELSRYSGLWVGFKVVTDVADGFGSANLQPIETIQRPEFTFNGRPWQPTQDLRLVAPFSLQLEHEIYAGRLEAARRFAAANGLNRIVVRGENDWLGIVAAGKTYYDLREALALLGLDEQALQQYGIRLLKIGLLYPLEPTVVQAFAQGLQTLLVVEEKRAFVEMFIQQILYNQAERPLVIGKQTATGEALVRADAELNVDLITQVLVSVLTGRIPEHNLAQRRADFAAPSANLLLPVINHSEPEINRSPYFCSGCPHNRSTVVPVGSIAGGGIGCHGMVLTMARNTQGITHMGGEGVQWVGAAPFTDTAHLFQNLGDGTLAHSGYMAIRQAVAAKVNITYKILYNEAVAMTGAQPADGGLPVPELTRALQAEGVAKIIICADNPAKYGRQAQFATGTLIWPRERLDDAQTRLRDTPGVTIIIYDQPCAADLRRQRKRGTAYDPPTRVFINEAVCEGCGDCGVKSNCLSVVPVDTEFGRKTQIHQPSCNKDYTCLEGDCPAFVTVNPAKTQSPKTLTAITISPEELPTAIRQVGDEANIFMVGIGGTGVVTINQILGTAAFLEGKAVFNLDQTGLSQKGGPVLSHVKIAARQIEIANKISQGRADVYLAFDALEAAKDKNLAQAHPQRTVAVVSMSQVATGEMVRSTDVTFPQLNRLRARIDQHTRAEDNLYFDANALSETIFGSHMQANLICVGAAYQAGWLPLQAATIERVIELNGVAAKQNILAFRVGRKVVAEPGWLPAEQLKRDGAIDSPLAINPTAQQMLAGMGAAGALRRLLEIRVPTLIAYQNAAYAQQYLDFVAKVQAAERQVSDRTELSEAVGRYLFKLMAYKDEYEVARLHLLPEFKHELAAQFGDDAQITYKLHPPLLRAMGMKQKIGLGQWFDGGFWLLTKLKVLRGTPFDIFGYDKVRRVERALIQEYRDLIESLIGQLNTNNYAQAVAIAKTPDLIRGYEQIKLGNVEKFRAEVARLQQQIQPAQPNGQPH